LSRYEKIGIHFSAPRDEPETLEDQIGDRLRSRLYEMCDIVQMLGADYRKTQSQRRQRSELWSFQIRLVRLTPQLNIRHHADNKDNNAG